MELAVDSTHDYSTCVGYCNIHYCALICLPVPGKEFFLN